MVRRKGIAVCAALVVCIACSKPIQRAKQIGRREPQIPATVITMQTAVQPANKTLGHQIVIANGLARSMNELDGWRLVDLNRNTVTFVDDIAKSYRTVPIQSLVKEHRAAVSGPLPDHAPRVQFAWTGAAREMLGISVRQALIRAGGYQRELWVGEHPAIPSNLFAVLYLSAPVMSRYASMMRDVDNAIIAMKGFPVRDHAEMPYGNTKMVVDRAVLKIEQRNVPQAWLTLPRNYREATAPAAGRPPASSRPSNQRTPGAESQSSSTGRKAP